MAPASDPVCSISVDLDPLGCYYAIHGLGEPPEALRDVVLRRGLKRFLELLSARGLPATFFVVGTDLAPPAGQAGRQMLRRAVAEGHELGNHTFRHRYELSRLPPQEMAEEIDRAHELIADCAGSEPVGFRAPGYNLNGALLTAVAARSYRYDSSLLPAPPYYGAKAAVMGVMRLAGRRSHSILGDPRQLAGQRLPYRPDERAPWRRGHARLVELPITVTRWLRVPVIGSYVVGWPAFLRSRLLDAAAAMPFFNFELHGIDLIDAEEDSIPLELVARQADLRVPLAHKRRALEDTLDRLADRFRFATLRDVAASFDQAR